MATILDTAGLDSTQTWSYRVIFWGPLLEITSNFPPGSMSDAIAGDDQAEQNPMIMDPIETANAAKTCSKDFLKMNKGMAWM